MSYSNTLIFNGFCYSLLIRYKIIGDEFFHILVRSIGIPKFLQPLLFPLIRASFGKKVYQRSTGSIGDFELKEMDDILHRDFQTIQDYLGDQKFLFGDKVTAVCEIN